jgi:hypothetical protein
MANAIPVEDIARILDQSKGRASWNHLWTLFCKVRERRVGLIEIMETGHP